MYARQGNVLDRLALEQKRKVRTKAEEPARQMFMALWSHAVRDVIAHARGLWAEAGRGGMSPELYARLGIQERMKRYVNDRIGRQFKPQAVDLLVKFMRAAYQWQYLTTLWILDSVTPPNIVVRPKRDLALYHPIGRKRPDRAVLARVRTKLRKQSAARESWLDAPPEGGQDVNATTGQPQSAWDTWLDAWLKGWGASAIANLGLAATRQSAAQDVAEAIARTLVEGRTPEAVLDTMVRSQINISVDDGNDDSEEDWGHITDTRIWVTRGDSRVCSLCRDLEGLTEKEVEEEWPGAQPGHVHPICRCRWFFRVRNFQSLTTDETRWERARGDEMVIRDPETGRPMATLVVEFGKWASGL